MYVAMVGLTPLGAPVSSSLPVTRRKLLRLIPALRTPVGASWDRSRFMSDIISLDTDTQMRENE